MRRLASILSAGIGSLLLASSVHSADLQNARNRQLVDSWNECVATLRDMYGVTTAIEAFAIDYGEYPKAANMSELRTLLEPHYIKRVPLEDAWGTEYRYVRASDRKSFRLASAGSDRTFDPASWETGALLSSSKGDAVLGAERQNCREWVIQE